MPRPKRKLLTFQRETGGEYIRRAKRLSRQHRRLEKFSVYCHPKDYSALKQAFYRDLASPKIKAGYRVSVGEWYVKM